jgi:hypothetical protein
MLGTIQWKGDRGNPDSKHFSRSKVKNVTDFAALEVLVTALSAFTLCNAARRSVSEWGAGTATPPGVGANIDERAIIYFQDPAGDTHSITIPAWDETTYPLDPESEGDRIADADVAAIVSAINTATGITHVALWGKHIKKT